MYTKIIVFISTITLSCSPADNDSYDIMNAAPSFELTPVEFQNFVDEEGGMAFGTIVLVEGYLYSDGKGTVGITSLADFEKSLEEKGVVLINDPTPDERIAFSEPDFHPCIGKYVEIVGGIGNVRGDLEGLGIVTIRYIKNKEDDSHCFQL